MELTEIVQMVFYDDDLTRHLKRAGKSGRKAARPAAKGKRAQRVGTALAEAGAAVNIVGARAEKQRRAQRRTTLLKAGLAGGAAVAVAGVAKTRADAAKAKTEAAPVPAATPTPEPVNV